MDERLPKLTVAPASEGASNGADDAPPPQEKLDFIAQVRDLLKRCAPDRISAQVLARGDSENVKENHGALMAAANVMTGILAEFRKRGTSSADIPPGFGYDLSEPITFIGLDRKGELRVSNEKMLVGYSPREIVDRITSFLDTGAVPKLEARVYTRSQPETGATGGEYRSDADWFYDFFRNMRARAQASEEWRRDRAEERANFVRVISEIQGAQTVEALRDIIFSNEFVVRFDNHFDRSAFDWRDVRPGSTGRMASNRHDEWSWEASEKGVALWFKKLESLNSVERELTNLITLHTEARDFFESMWASETSAYGRAITNQIELMILDSVHEKLQIARLERWSKREIEKGIMESVEEVFHPRTSGRAGWWTSTSSTQAFSDFRNEIGKAIDAAPIVNVRRLITNLRQRNKQ